VFAQLAEIHSRVSDAAVFQSIKARTVSPAGTVLPGQTSPRTKTVG
jgi:hypothetical protein